jgi:hypothetical protein
LAVAALEGQPVLVTGLLIGGHRSAGTPRRTGRQAECVHFHVLRLDIGPSMLLFPINDDDCLRYDEVCFPGLSNCLYR